MNSVITSTMVRSRFLAIKDNLDLVQYSLFRSTDLELTDEIYLRLRDDGKCFEDVAQYSDGPESQTGGKVGPYPISRAHPTISHHLRSLPIGHIKAPFFFDKWSVILRVDDRIGARFDDWENPIREQMEKEKNKWSAEYQLKNWHTGGCNDS